MEKFKTFMKKIKEPAWCVCFVLVSIFGALIIGVISWMMKTWADLTVDEIVFHLKVPIQGTSHQMLWQAILTGAIPCVITIIIVILVLRLTRNDKRRRILWGTLVMVASMGIAVFMIYIGIKKYDVIAYLNARNNESRFIEDNYIDPRNVSITFPEKKRNLIYVYLESMETAFASVEEGGGFEENLIPELTELAAQNVSFSQNDKFGGGVPTGGTTWTMAAMFAQTSGLPLKIPIYINAMSDQETFFPDIETLGDILEDEGYKQVLMVGSDSVFGGRKNYFTTHGSYEIFDHPRAIEDQKIPEDYMEFWGFEDQKLYEYAKEEITLLSQQDQPFNFTMLTVDTHFEDGYLCDLCSNEYGDNQYANAIRCASRQATDFVEWVKQQPFYENTTIILMGDHLSMDVDFFHDLKKGTQRRVYNAFINPAIEPAREKEYAFTTMDLFPTTLASIGAKINGEQLALGTNLFSGRETLLEKNGLGKINEEFDNKSVFYERFTEDIVIPGKWIEDDKGWRYQNNDGSYKVNESVEMGDRLYHFDENGYVASFDKLDRAG